MILEYQVSRRKIIFASPEFNLFIQSAKDATVHIENESFDVKRRGSLKGINSLKIGR